MTNTYYFPKYHLVTDDENDPFSFIRSCGYSKMLVKLENQYFLFNIYTRAGIILHTYKSGYVVKENLVVLTDFTLNEIQRISSITESIEFKNTIIPLTNLTIEDWEVLKL